MATTHFKITKLPDENKIISLLGLIPVQQNVLYPIEDESTLNFKRIDALDDFYVSESFMYKTHDSNLNLDSNEAVGNIVFKNADVIPASADFEETLNSLDEKILLEVLPLNSGVEFIEITAIDGVKNLKLNNIKLIPGNRIETSDLLSATFNVNEFGGGEPYFNLSYKVGRGKTLEATIYNYTVNVMSSAEINLIDTKTSTTNEEFDDGAGGIVNYDVIREVYEVMITKGYQNGTAEIEVTINADFLDTILVSTQSYIYVEVNGIEDIKSADEIFNLVANLDDNGSAYIKVTHEVIKDDANEIGSTTILLNSINEDLSLVSANDSVTLSTDV